MELLKSSKILMLKQLQRKVSKNIMFEASILTVLNSILNNITNNKVSENDILRIYNTLIVNGYIEKIPLKDHGKENVVCYVLKLSEKLVK